MRKINLSRFAKKETFLSSFIKEIIFGMWKNIVEVLVGSGEMQVKNEFVNKNAAFCNVQGHQLQFEV